MKNDKIELTFNQLTDLIARYLHDRIHLQCPCGENIAYPTRKELSKHLKHIISWGIKK